MGYRNALRGFFLFQTQRRRGAEVFFLGGKESFFWRFFLKEFRRVFFKEFWSSGVQTIVLLAWSLNLELLSQRSAGV